MTVLTQASRQWATRPADERFLSLHEMQDHFQGVRERSRALTVSPETLEVIPEDDHKGLQVIGPAGVPYAPTHYSFGQLCALAGPSGGTAPAGYLRGLPAELAADCLNYGLKFNRSDKDVSLLLYNNGANTLRAATGPRYGRIWNESILKGMVDVFGDGVTGYWKVPGEFGHDVEVTRENTTLYAGDRDMFVFLADEHNRIEIPNRRDGKSGTLARGFFVWNSEVGAATFGVSTFLFDYVCCNRMVWGVEEVKEIKLRHTLNAPERFASEIAPAMESLSHASTHSIVQAVEAAQKAKIETDVTAFLANRFGKKMSGTLQMIHMEEEGRPIETLWDAATAVTAHARTLEWQDERVAMEREGGALVALAQ